MAVAVGSTSTIGAAFLRGVGSTAMGDECQDGPFYNVDARTRKAMQRSLSVLQMVRADNSLHRVADRLYLSSVSGAINLNELRRHKITHILCVASGIRPLYPDCFTYKCADILDAESESLLDILPSCLSWMISAQREDSRNTILVHCFAGRSRSVGVLLAYFVLVMRIPFRLAFAHLRRMRPECSPNNGFMQQLAAFEKEVLKNSGPISVSRPSAIFAVENLEEKLELVVMAAKERLRVMDAELLASPQPLPTYFGKASQRESTSFSPHRMPPRKVAAKSKPSSPAAQRKKSEEEEVEVVVENDGGKAGAVGAEGGEETVEISSSEPTKDVEMTPVELVEEAEGEEKREEAEEVKEEVPAEMNDFEEDTRPRVTEIGKFGSFDSTLDTYFGFGGLLGSNSTEGFQYLLSGARSNIGVKGGRRGIFAFEVKIAEVLTPMDSACNRQAYLPLNKHCLRVGFSTIEGSVLLGTDEHGVAFDAGLGYDRVYGHPKQQHAGRFANGPCVWKGTHTTFIDKADFGLDDIVTVVLNLGEDSDDHHSNSIALFKNGQRVTDPIPIPAELLGKDIFPTITFKNVRVAINLGHSADGRRPAELAGLTQRLPFRCRSLQQSAAEDISVSPYFSNQPKEPEALILVGLPDQGVFDFVDYFMKKNPYKYTEILVEIKGGLLQEERAKIMSKFSAHKRIARICVGEPDPEYQNYVKDLVRGEIVTAKSAERERKIEELKKEWKARMVEKERQRKVKAAARAAEKARREAAAEARRKRKEAAMRAAAAKRAAEARKGDEPATDEASENKTADDVVMNAQEEAESEEEHVEEVEEEEEADEPEPTLPEVEVTDDDLRKAMTGGYFRRQRLHDISPGSLSAGYLSFTLPNAEDSFEDGRKVFDEVVYEWEKKEDAENKLAAWIRNRKVLEKVPSITKPSEWFEVQKNAWSETKLEWRKKHRTYLQAVAMREAAAKKAESEKAAKEGQEVKAEASAEPNDTPQAESPAADAAAAESPAYIDPDDADVWAVEDINDLDGKGTPLYGKFKAEDWQLLNLRYDLHLLCHAFFRDATAEDPDIKGIHRSLLQHYYQTYFAQGPPLLPSLYGGKSVDELLDTFVVDTITVGDDGVLRTVHDIDTPQSTFVRLVEAARREREKRIEAGDESARIRIAQPVTAPRNSGGGKGPTVRDNRSSGHRGGKGGVGHPTRKYGQQQHHNRYSRSLPSSPGPRGGYQGARLPPRVHHYQHTSSAAGHQYGSRYANTAPAQSGYYGGQQQYNAGYKRGYESAGVYEYEAGKRQKGGGPPPGQYYQASHQYGGQYYRQ
ncbi:phosphatase [Perkinsus olseni]|uniref:Phosphatase n=2 Tax=Perkinsus olseni TaxID=32597 RepID=A0A7J6LXG2_PEROL|nr:phosphatase [Perkinsus olseni]